MINKFTKLVKQINLSYKKFLSKTHLSVYVNDLEVEKKTSMKKDSFRRPCQQVIRQGKCLTIELVSNFLVMTTTNMAGEQAQNNKGSFSCLLMLE